MTKRAQSSDVEEALSDVAGVDFKIARTARDLVFRPGRVLDHAVNRDRSAYTPPLRVFLLLFTVQLVVMNWLEIDTASQVLSSMTPDTQTALSAALAERGIVMDEYFDAVNRWTQWVTWPAMIFGSLPFIAVFFVFRRAVGWLGAALIYVTVTNASWALSLPVMVAGIWFGGPWVFPAFGFMFLAFFVYMWPALRRHLSTTLLGAIGKLALVILLTPFTLILNMGLVYAGLHFGLDAEFGAGIFEVIALSQEVSVD